MNTSLTIYGHSLAFSVVVSNSLLIGLWYYSRLLWMASHSFGFIVITRFVFILFQILTDSLDYCLFVSAIFTTLFKRFSRISIDAIGFVRMLRHSVRNASWYNQSKKIVNKKIENTVTSRCLSAINICFCCCWVFFQQSSCVKFSNFATRNSSCA